MAGEFGLQGYICPTVSEAVIKAIKNADKEDIIFIGGSSFIVADALPMFI
jgi:dihydrofolate synthase/folylpolyglutamate synthase